jgi:carbonic anhydrase
MNDRLKSSRRDIVKLAAALGPLCFRMMAAPQQKGQDPRHMNPDQTLSELLAGNQRFVTGKPQTPRRSPAEFQALAHGQFPEAVIVSCADSRVAPEILFDVGVGDIFVVRVAGNIVGGAVVVKGSIEYAVAELNVPLIMVLGHSGCGAVKSALQHIDKKDSLPGSINGLVDLVKPAVEKSKGMPGDPLENAIRENVVIGVERLRGLEPIIAPKVREGKVKVVGGVYDLRTGAVTMIGAGK